MSGMAADALGAGLLSEAEGRAEQRLLSGPSSYGSSCQSRSRCCLPRDGTTGRRFGQVYRRARQVRR
jgi:hypothetical protein